MSTEEIRKIPFNKPALTGKEFEYMQLAIDEMHISGDGPFTAKCATLLQEELGVTKVLLTTSCTHALEIAAFLLDLGPGDEVIVPSFTFTSTANAFALRGASIVFADIRPDTLNLDVGGLAGLITPRTRAVVPVHYAGVGCEMEALLPLAADRDVTVVEDNAHGLFGRYRGTPLGTFGSLAALSFHETKNFFCGEGGALLINEKKYLKRAEIIREKGTNRSQFFRGEADRYTWVDFGSSYLPSDLLASFLYAQLENRERVLALRRKVWNTYSSSLQDWARDASVRLPVVPSHCEQAYHMFYLLMPSPQSREDFIAYMKEAGIDCVFHYLPLHLSKMGRHFGGREGDCPVTEDVSARLVRLPFYNSLSGSDQDRIIARTSAFRPV